jgi:hypothetical protein
VTTTKLRKKNSRYTSSSDKVRVTRTSFFSWR